MFYNAWTLRSSDADCACIIWLVAYGRFVSSPTGAFPLDPAGGLDFGPQAPVPSPTLPPKPTDYSTDTQAWIEMNICNIGLGAKIDVIPDLSEQEFIRFMWRLTCASSQSPNLVPKC